MKQVQAGPKRIVVIGAGAAGTAAAYVLTNRGYDILILERELEVGGRIKSHIRLGGSYEVGAGFLLKPLYANTFQIIHEIGLEDDLYLRRDRPTFRQAINHFLRNAKTLSVRTLYQLLSLTVKVHLVGRRLDITDISRARRINSQTVAQAFSKKRFQQLMDAVIMLVMDGYFYWQPSRTSLAVLLAVFKGLNQKSQTYILKHGLQQIPRTLAAQTAIQTGADVQSIERMEGNQWRIKYIKQGKVFELVADGVVCATTASAVPRMFPTLTPDQRNFFETVSYSSTVVVTRTIANLSQPSELPLTQLHQPDSKISAITYVRNPAAKGWLMVEKVSASGAYGAAFCKLSDTELLTELTSHAPQIFVGAKHDIQRWPEALPEFTVKHITGLAAFKKGCIETKQDRLTFAGDYIGGPFIEGAIRSGLEAAERLHDQFN